MIREPAAVHTHTHTPSLLLCGQLPFVTAASFRNIHSDEPPPVKVAPDVDMSEGGAAEEAGPDSTSAKAGRRNKLTDVDKRSATSKSRHERRSSKPPSPAPQTQTPPPEPEPVK